MNITEPVSTASRDLIAKLYPGLRPIAFRVLQDALHIFKRPMRVTDGFRSMDDQLNAYKKGRVLMDSGNWLIRDLGQIVTNARPGMSFHNYGLAFDCCFQGSDPYLEKETKEVREDMWSQYGKIVNGNALHWGGDFRLKNGAKDLPHAELSYGLQVYECLELYANGKIDSVWAHIDHIRGVDEGQDWRGKWIN